MDTKITPSDVIGKDPFGRILSKLRIKPWQAAFLSLSFFLLYMLALPAWFGVLFPREGLLRSSSVDRINQVGFWVIHPIVVFFYIWQSVSLARLYDLVLPLTSQDLAQKLTRAARIAHKGRAWWMPGFTLGLFVVYLGLMSNIKNLGLIWYSINWLMIAILQLSRLLLFYMMMAVVVRHLVASSNLNRIYREVRLPLMIARTNHRFAFNAITNYGLSFAMFGATLGLFLAMRYFYSTPSFPEDAIYLLLYFLLIPFSFFLPFWQAHVKMRNAREEALSRISKSLQEEYDRLMSAFELDSDRDLSSERLKSIQELNLLTQKSPTWPFEILSVYQLFGTAIVPFVLPAISYIADVLSLIK